MRYWGWPVYFLVVFVLLIVCVWIRLPQEVLKAIECFLKTYSSMFWSVGTVILVSILSVLATGVANMSASADRITQAELKFAQFRQEWINELRQDLAEIVGLCGHYTEAQMPKEDLEKLISKLRQLDARVRLRLNPNEKKAIELANEVCQAVDAVEKRKLEAIDLRDKLAKTGAIYLKNEWEVVKKVLALAKHELS